MHLIIFAKFLLMHLNSNIEIHKFQDKKLIKVPKPKFKF